MNPLTNYRMTLKPLRVFALLLSLFITAGTFGLQHSDAAPLKTATVPEIAIYLEGAKLAADVPPFIVPKLNVTMVPLRIISEGLGAAVDWKASSRSVSIQRAGTFITLQSGQGYATVNGTQVKLDSSVQSIKGRTMVPLRFVGESLGLTVNWNQADRSISLFDRDETGVGDGTNGENGSDGENGSSGGNGTDSLRGAWISTVYNLDWPSAQSAGDEARQKAEFTQLLDELQRMGLNAAFVQVRPAGDALYASALVPWSKYLTGTQGKAPTYDPLTFMVEETHKRGMEFHAWFNPFRASVDAKTDTLAPNHVILQHPDWIVNSGGKPYLNPGLPAARQHIIDTIMEVVSGYDVDGIHLDDYFYPSSGDFPDSAAFTANNPLRLSLADWRQANVNAFVSQLGESIHALKPSVRFGISPFGVWRNQSLDPTGSPTKASITDYDNMYADVRTWIKQQWIDYVAPQIYWSFANLAVPYDKLVDWWSNEVKGTDVDLYIGHSPYKLGTTEAGWQSSSEIINQLNYAKTHTEVDGDIFFSAKDLRRNPLGIMDALRDYYKTGSGKLPVEGSAIPGGAAAPTDSATPAGSAIAASSGQ